MSKDNLCFDKNKVWLAEVKYYSKEDNGIELTEPLSYAFVVDLDDEEFVNPFNVADDLPVFKRLPYGNYRTNGEGFGSKVMLVNNIEKTGLCFVLCKNVGDMGIEGDIVTSKDLVDYMFDSGLYFKDRKQFFNERALRKPFSIRKLVAKDEQKYANMMSFLLERSGQPKLVK